VSSTRQVPISPGCRGWRHHRTFVASPIVSGRNLTVPRHHCKSPLIASRSILSGSAQVAAITPATSSSLSNVVIGKERNSNPVITSPADVVNTLTYREHLDEMSRRSVATLPPYPPPPPPPTSPSSMLSTSSLQFPWRKSSLDDVDDAVRSIRRGSDPSLLSSSPSSSPSS